MKANDWFSGGLGRGGRMASWVVGIGMAGVWYYMENREKLQPKRDFSSSDTQAWNEKRKKEFKDKGLKD